MTNIVPLHKCVCGEAGLPRTMQWKDETITIFACDKCVGTVDGVIARVRPVFDTMRACGVPRDIANDTMTFLLDQLPDALDGPSICTKCGRPKRAKCEDGWLPPIGPCSDDSYITTRPCPNA
jgi:hypothetical protein